jgi:TonB-dependent receptor
MKMFTVVLVFISLFVIVNSSIVIAQGGNSKIQGKVTDVSTGEPLFGANVILTGTSLGAASGIDGGYQITNVPPGTYSVQITYIGYKNYKAENVQVLPGKTIVLDAKLTLESIEGQTVLVTAQKQGQISAINQQLSSNSIKDIVAKDWIQEVPDVNAAESISRLPGVSVQRNGGEGDKIIVRGLSPQFNNIQIDGVQLQGVDFDRSVGLSIISDKMLEGIELSKSLTPDMDADALGGTVNLTTKEAEEGLHYNAFAQGAYNNAKSDYGNYEFDFGVSDRFLNNSLGVIVNAGTQKINRSSDSFTAGYDNFTPSTGVNALRTTSANITQNLDERYRSYGNIVLDYKTDFMKLKMNNMLTQQLDDNQSRSNGFGFGGNTFSFNINKSKPIETIRSHSLTGVFSFLNTDLTLEGSYSRTTLNNYQDQYNFYDQDLFVAYNKSIPPSALTWAQPSSLITHYYNISMPLYSDLQNNLMETTKRKDETYTYKVDWKIPYNITKGITGFLRVGGMYSDKDRNNGYLQLDGAYLGGKGDQFMAQMKGSPLFSNLLYNGTANPRIPRSDGMPAMNWVVPNYDWQNILSGRYTLGYSENLSALDNFSNAVYKFSPTFTYYDGIPTYQNDYSNNEKKTAAYILTELHITENLMLLPGIRYEKFQSVYNSFFIQAESEAPSGIQYIKPVSSNNNNEHWFPSVNSKFTINEWSDIRAAYYASCTRPDYSLLSPGVTADAGKQNLIVYNPYLKPATANNFDVIYSFHSNEIGLFSIDCFYKVIDGLITSLPNYQPQFYNMVQNAPSSLIGQLEAPRALYDPNLFKVKGQNLGSIPINNPDKTYFRGIEVNWETNFWYLPGLLSNLVLDINYSKIGSSTQNPYLNIVNITKPGSIIPTPTPFYLTRASRMYNQPSDIFNVRLGWDYKGFSTRITYRYQGQVLTGFDAYYSLKDSYSKALNQLDLQVTQKLYNNFTLQAAAQNITNYIDDSYIQAYGYQMPTSSNYYGITAQIGIKYEY